MVCALLPPVDAFPSLRQPFPSLGRLHPRCGDFQHIPSLVSIKVFDTRHDTGQFTDLLAQNFYLGFWCYGCGELEVTLRKTAQMVVQSIGRDGPSMCPWISRRTLV